MAIPASELLQIQQDLAAVCLDKQCEIQRNTPTKGAFGEEVANYGHLSNCKAGMKQPSANLLQNYDFRIGDLAAWHIKFAYGQDVRRTDHLLIENQTLEVHVLLDPHTVPGLTSVIAAELK